MQHETLVNNNERKQREKMKAHANNNNETSSERPSDEQLAKMSDAEILAGDWLVDISDNTFWNRWDEANFNLTNQIDVAVAEGRAMHYRPVPIWRPDEKFITDERGNSDKAIHTGDIDQELAAMYERQDREMKALAAERRNAENKN